jgi:citrate synthase
MLAASARLESVATLLWGADGADPFADAARFAPIVDLPPAGEIVTRLLIGLASAAETDLAGHARSADGIARTGARILTQMVATATGRAPAGRAVHDALAQGWDVPEAADLIRRALIVMADHELAASTFAVRVAASTGASPWRAVTAGLACLDGPRHGGAAARAAALLSSLAVPSDAERVIAERLRHGETIAGFGHPLYPGIDPRAAILLAAARALPVGVAPSRAPMRSPRRRGTSLGARRTSTSAWRSRPKPPACLGKRPLRSLLSDARSVGLPT